MERQIPVGLRNININSKIMKVKSLLKKICINTFLNIYKHGSKTPTVSKQPLS